jgi:hypothetical protein
MKGKGYGEWVEQEEGLVYTHKIIGGRKICWQELYTLLWKGEF